MKIIATLILCAGLCGAVSAAPITGQSKTIPVDVVTTNNLHSADVFMGGGSGGSAPTTAPIPEPATMALLGLGLGVAALRRRK